MLTSVVRDGGADPFNGALYVFRSKRADRIKAVWFDGNYSEYEADRKIRLGAATERPHRIKYRKLTKS